MTTYIHAEIVDLFRPEHRLAEHLRSDAIFKRERER